MDSITIDYTKNFGGTVTTPTNEVGAGGEIIFNDAEIIAQKGLSIGLPTGGITGGYRFPVTIGTNNQILKADIVNNRVIWSDNLVGGGGGDIINGGNTGPVVIGTTDATATSIISGAGINIGQLNTPNQISLNGSVGYQYDKINTAVGTLNLNADYFFIEVTNAGTNTISLPDASTAVGRQYIISKGFVGGTLTITTTASDNIDGIDTIILKIVDQRVKLISNGLDKWVII